MPRSYRRGERHDLFELAVNAYLGWDRCGALPIVEYDGDELLLADVCGLVWNLADIVPASVSDDVREYLDHKSTTYAAIARAMLDEIRPA